MKINIRRSSLQTCLLAAALLALPATVHAQFTYTTNNGAITITGYTGSGGAVNIPATINGLPVTGIGDDAFVYCTSLTSVTIPDSVTSIEPSAFQDCSGLTNVTIPDSVTNIGQFAFVSCTNLMSVTIGNSVKSIGNEAFNACYSLTNITVSAQNPVYSSVDGVLFDKNQTTLVEYPAGGPANYTIPDSVTSIGYEAFYDCDSLSSVTIGNGVTSVQDGTFFDCKNLTNVTIPNSVTNIESSAFYECFSLKNVTIGNGVTNISNDMFIGSSLITIMVSAQNPLYSSVNGVLFNKSKTTLILCPPGLGSYTIPNGITNIGNYAFGYCYYLASVTIPNNVTNIGSGAFYQCFSLKNLTIPNSVIGIGSNAFYECSSLRRIYFTGNAPAADSSVFSFDYTTAYYLTNASGWSNTFAGIPTAVWNPAPPPILCISQSSSGVMTLSWKGNMVLIYSGSLDFNYPWFRAGDTSPVTAPIGLGNSSRFTGPIGLNSQFFRLMDVTDLVADFYANLILARINAPVSIRLQACKACAADYFLSAPFGDLRDGGDGDVDEAMAIGYDLDPTDPILLNDIGLLKELRRRNGP